jgi:hypothetical protein
MVRIFMLTKGAKVLPHSRYQQVLATPAFAVAERSGQVSKAYSLL